jgi:pSer/pThr/pTyr-binding forkhead associated (FHA) protein
MAKKTDHDKLRVTRPENDADDPRIRQTTPETHESDAAEHGVLRGPNQIFDDQIEKKSTPAGPSDSDIPRNERMITRDTVREIYRKRTPKISLPEADIAPSAELEIKIEHAATFYPVHRPKTPTLFMMDDNQETAEAFRLRLPQTVIGRTRGDILVPNDAHVSERHVEIRRELVDNQYTWLLSDLRSTNGTYLRILKQFLDDGDCLLLGGRYFRFSQFDPEDPEENVGKFGLVEFAHPKNEQRRLFFLSKDQDNVIGNSQHDINGNEWEDKYLDGRHAKIVCDPDSHWSIEDLDSHNGTWVRVNSLKLEDGISFQLGGQRFTFSISE